MQYMLPSKLLIYMRENIPKISGTFQRGYRMVTKEVSEMSKDGRFAFIPKILLISRYIETRGLRKRFKGRIIMKSGHLTTTIMESSGIGT